MSEEATQTPDGIELSGLYAFKVGMSSIYNEAGESIPVTVLKYDPWVVSQVKTQDTDGYEAIQISCRPKKKTTTKKADLGHLKKAGFETSVTFTREIRQNLPEGVEAGKKVLLSSLTVGDQVKLTSKSKGRGFAGVMKRYGHGGGPASHGSGFHRRPGSIGNCTFPGRVMAGRKMPGHYGVETVTIPRVKVVGVDNEENVILVKGPVPGSVDSLVRLMKQ